MLAALDISTTALVSQRTRLNAIASNIANISTTHNEEGERVPYQPRFVILQTDESVGDQPGTAGVKVASVEIADLDPLWKYQPNHPDAQQEGDRQGYVAYPNVDLTTEFVDSLEATRAYEANIGVIEVTKELAVQTLKILA